MEFLKKHYEKILLSIVLLGVAIAAGWLPFAIAEAKIVLDARTKTLPAPKLVKPIDLTSNEAAVSRLKEATVLSFSGAHNLFNPVVWKQKFDGTLLKVTTGNEIGLKALNIVRIY